MHLQNDSEVEEEVYCAEVGDARKSYERSMLLDKYWRHVRGTYVRRLSKTRSGAKGPAGLVFA